MSIKGGKPNERRVVAHLMVPNGRDAIDFYERALGAKQLYASEIPGGRIVHAHLRVRDSVILITEETLREHGQEEPKGAQMEPRVGAPRTIGGTAVMLEMYVDDVDAAFNRAIEAGGRSHNPVQETFFGDRYGTFIDPFGHVWSLATVVEELTPEQVSQRAMARFAR
jgi:PhnB protein